MMSLRRPAVLLAVAVSIHCGGGSSGGTDAALDAPIVDAPPVDAATDAPPVDAAIDAPTDAREPLPPCTGTLTFTQQAPLAGDSPFALVTADFNGDTHVDVLAGNGVGQDIRVFLGRGDGTFDEAPRVHAGNPRSIVTGDFDGNGVLDLAIANFGDENLQLALGMGDGRFEEQKPVDVGTRPIGLVATDVDHDGDLDLATVDGFRDRVAVVRNLGDGTFDPQVLPIQTFPTYSTPNGLVTTDVNLDGHADLIVSNRTASAALLLGDGAGGFAAPAELPFDQFQLAIFLGDLDGNGHGDLVLSSTIAHQLQVRRHDGTGGFAAPTTYAAGDQPVSVSAGDFDGDGDLDLVHLEYDVSTFTVRLAAPPGVFGGPLVHPVGGFVQPRMIVAADLDHDAHADLLVARSGSDDVGIYLAGCQP